jgi:hypothetical protein
MKELTQEEYQDRLGAIQRAMAIFGELTNNDITKSFQAYQLIFAERERAIFLNTQVQGNRPQTLLDRYQRPKCPDCSSDMLFRNVPENSEGIKTQLVCSNNDCDLVLSSDKTLDDWIKILKVKNGTE